MSDKCGTYAGWQVHIKAKEKACARCQEARRAYQRQRSYDRQLGRPRRVDPGPARDHIRYLVANGMTLGAIAEASGVHPHTVETIWQGSRAKASADHATWLLAVQLEVSPTGVVPSIGSTRRLKALARLGWSVEHIAAAAKRRGHHIEAGSLKSVRISRRELVRTTTAAGIAAAYDELSMKLPKSGRGVNSLRTRAANAKWPPPLAWQNIDDPNERPHGNRFTHRAKTDIDPVAVDRAIAGGRVRLTRAERFEVVGRMQAAGWSLQRIEEQTGITRADRYVSRGDVA